MDGTEFKRCLCEMGMTQTGYAELIERDGSTVRRRTFDASEIPTEGAILARLLARHPELVEEAKELAGLPVAAPARKRAKKTG